jgi:uncharacterized protein
MASLIFTTGNGSYEEFLTLYESSEKPDSAAAGELLFEAVSNDDLVARVAIASRLLDDGADATYASSSGANALHAMLGRRKQDFAAEAPLLERLIASGADINKVIPRFGTPLETATLDSAFTEAELGPVYDVFFAQPNLDLLKTSIYKRTVMANLRDCFEDRTDLIARAEAYLAERGLSES